MGGAPVIVDRLFRPRSGERGLTPATAWGADLDWRSGNTIAGVSVSAETALNATAVWACVRLLSNDIAGLPLHAFRGTGPERERIALPAWMVQPDPNPNITRSIYIGSIVSSMLLDGNAFIRVAPGVYQPESIQVLDPAAVEVRVEGNNTWYIYENRRLSWNEIVHIPLLVAAGRARGLNPIDAARESIGLTLAADQYASAYFGNGAQLGLYAQFPTGVTVDPESAKNLHKRMEGHTGPRKAFRFGILDNGGELKTAAVNNKDGQLHELRLYQTEETARLFGIPPHMIGSQQPGAVAYASVEQRSIDYVTHAVQPIVERIEDAHERMLRGSRTYFKFSLQGLLRADHQTRWNAYAVALDKKVMRREEVRAFEDLPYDADATGWLETPNNNRPGGGPAPAPDPAANGGTNA